MLNQIIQKVLKPILKPLQLLHRKFMLSIVSNFEYCHKLDKYDYVYLSLVVFALRYVVFYNNNNMNQTFRQK